MRPVTVLQASAVPQLAAVRAPLEAEDAHHKPPPSNLQSALYFILTNHRAACPHLATNHSPSYTTRGVYWSCD